MSGREPLYRKAFIFFSSTIPKELVNHIKSDSSVLPRIGALREVFLFYAIIPSLFTYSFIAFWFLNFLLLSIQMNMEYFPIDNQGFLTDHEQALETLYAEDAENSRHFHICLNIMATRIATVFASLKVNTFCTIHQRLTHYVFLS
jgi:syntaxin-binding protein 1